MPLSFFQHTAFVHTANQVRGPLCRHCSQPSGVCAFAAGFTGDFWRAYHEVIPKAPGFDRRKDLYLLYHYLNHTNLFGGRVHKNLAFVHLPMLSGYSISVQHFNALAMQQHLIMLELASWRHAPMQASTGCYNVCIGSVLRSFHVATCRRLGLTMF